MPEGPKATYGRVGGRKVVTGYKGANADKSYASTEELEDKKQRQQFDTENGWSGIAGAARKPQGAEYEKKYREWKKAKQPPKPKGKASAQLEGLGD